MPPLMLRLMTGCGIAFSDPMKREIGMQRGGSMLPATGVGSHGD